jgi:hypothetical protein
MADILDGIVIGAAAAAIGTIFAMKVLNAQPTGGGQPRQVDRYSGGARSGALRVIDPMGLDERDASPLVQNSPITEAAYNQQSQSYAPAFGPNENQPAEETVLPI